MGFARIGNKGITFVKGGSGIVGDANFYRGDVQLVANQPGSKGTSYIKAIVNSEDCLVCVAVSSLNGDGSAASFLEDAGHYIALSCPPFAALLEGEILR